MRKRHTLESVRAMFEESKLTLLSNNYNCNVPLYYVCQVCNNKNNILMSNFIAGKRCNICSQNNMALRVLDKNCRELSVYGYKVLEKKFVKNGKSKYIKCLCKNNHKSLINLEVVKRAFKKGIGNGCKMCATGILIKRQTLSYHYVKGYFERFKYNLLDKIYINSQYPMKTICPNGHKYQTKFANFKTGHRCNKCACRERGVRHRLSYDQVKRDIEYRGYKLISREYTLSILELDIVCPNGHDWKVNFMNFQAGTCPKCSHNGFSAIEKEVFSFVKELMPNAIENDKKLLGGMELDILVPECNLAIEFCGLYWHNDDHKKSSYHREKFDKCNKAGYRLITIFEDEWEQKSHIVKSRIRQALNKTDKRVYARKCNIKIIGSKVANDFYRENHLQGATRGKIHFGLIHEGNIVQCLSVGSLSRNHVSLGNMIELKRISSKIDLSVVGGAGKLLKAAKQFCRENGFTKIRSYCDLRYGTGGLYKILGFDYVTESRFTPQYIKNRQRIRNQSLQKTSKERLTGKTEKQLRKEQGYTVIYDCGHSTWDYSI